MQILHKTRRKRLSYTACNIDIGYKVLFFFELHFIT